MVDSQLYSIDFVPETWVALGLMVVCMVLIALLMWPRLSRVARRVGRDDRRVAEAVEAMAQGRMKPYPPMSVIVYSRGNGENLRTLLPQILNQDYPAQMEVIVVNDECNDSTEAVVSELGMTYPNLYMTFAPERSRGLSRRKLAITLAVKAARFDALLLTCGNCRVESPLWARAMMRHLISGRREVVIGYAEPWGDGTEDTDSRRRRRDFDFVWESVAYLNAAIRKHPLRGTGYNLSYTRRLFFEHKGFSRTLSLNYGDDDVFVAEIASGNNTAVELSHAGRVKSTEHSPARMHDVYRMRRDFTASYIRRGPAMAMGLTSLLWWAWIVFGVVGAWMAWPSLVGVASVAVFGLLFSLIHGLLWRRCSRALGMKPLMWTVGFLALTRPFRTLRHRIKGHFARRQNLI